MMYAIRHVGVCKKRAIRDVGAGLKSAAVLALAAMMALHGPAASQEAAGPEAAAAGDTPEATVRTLHEALVEVAAEHGDGSVEERYRALEPVVAATHDLPYIAELTIRREWRDLSAEQRRRFVDAFVRLSVATYASRFRNLREGMFEIAGSASLPAGRAQVTATLTTEVGEAIPFEYVLHESGGSWRIVNILANEVSDLALKRAEYRRLLEAGTIDDVIAELERQAEEVAAVE